MKAVPTVREFQNLHEYLDSTKAETFSWLQVFDYINRSVPNAEALLVSTFPRGGLQIVQPARVSEVLVKYYCKEHYLEDRPSWTALTENRAVSARECWPAGEFEASRYNKLFLQPHGFEFVAVVPVVDPVIAGYPGVLQLYRTSEQGDFSAYELSQLAEFATHLGNVLAQNREARRSEESKSTPPLQAKPPVRHLMFDAQMRPILGGESYAQLDERLRMQMYQHAEHRLANLNGQAVADDRLALPDSRGDIWIFRAVLHREFPAMGNQAVSIFCLQPSCDDWSVLRSADLAADVEVSRLVPPMEFMRQEFARGPTLVEIAKTAHLSPFHFHRRFTELMGLTPKHFLLECQITAAKRHLLGREKELAEIATACGFAHQSHFTSRFKQATGLTPTRWRRVATDPRVV